MSIKRRLPLTILLLTFLMTQATPELLADSKLAESKPAAKKGSPEPAKKPAEKKDEKKEEKKADAKEEEYKEPVITNAVDVATKDLVDRPKEFLGKNVKFQANFAAFSNLALSYKPAFRDPKKYISILVFRPGKEGHIPYSELKLAMLIPKEEKDPRSKLLAGLKDGDTIEITGNVFSTALDEPWVDILKLKKIASAKKTEDDDDEE
ncbi:MAG: hypothetical protein IPM23_26105 [Candidatus Melainabacteria bacterium]|nr:hypothetical protein [Candidatus Melainabacteria bacterium]